MKNLLLFALLLAAFPACAQGFEADVTNARPVAPKPAVSANGRITGTVLCGDTRKPARGAMLIISAVPKANPDGSAAYVEGAHESMTRVGLDGSYTVEHLPPGEYGVIAVFPGYLTPFDNMMASQMEDSSPAAQRALLSKMGTVVIRGAESESFNLTLERGAAVSGRVVYSDGSPAAQVTIDLEDTTAAHKTDSKPQENVNVGRAMRSLFTQQSNATDDQGHFRIAGVPPGTYRIAAVQSFSSSSGGGGEGMGMMFGAMLDSSALHLYGGDTTHRKSAKIYELRAGDELTGVDITIPERAFHHVSGRLLGAAGRAPNSATITLTDSADDTLIYTTPLAVAGGVRAGAPAAEARFDFPSVPAGTYTLAVKEAEYTPAFDYKPGPNGKVAAPPANVPYAPATTSVLVKDADVPELSLTVTELPPNTKAPPQ